jgi:hypothetical protein
VIETHGEAAGSVATERVAVGIRAVSFLFTASLTW